jgi:mandelamide amidase
MESALKRLQDYGIELVETDLTEASKLDTISGFPIAQYEVVHDLEQYLAEHRTGLSISDIAAQTASPDVKDIFNKLLNEKAVPKETYLEARQKHRQHLQAMYRECFAKHQLSAVVFPTTPIPAIPIGEDETTLLNGKAVLVFPTFIRNTSPGSVAGIPGLSLPVGMSPDGLPIGMEIDSSFGNDDQLLAIGMAIEDRERSV